MVRFVHAKFVLVINVTATITNLLLIEVCNNLQNKDQVTTVIVTFVHATFVFVTIVTPSGVLCASNSISTKF